MVAVERRLHEVNHTRLAVIKSNGTGTDFVPERYQKIESVV
jgi:hypothetical protein